MPRRRHSCRSLALHCASSLRHSETQIVSSVSSQSSKQSINMPIHSVAQATDISLSLIQNYSRLPVEVDINWVKNHWKVEKSIKRTYGHDRAHHPLDTIVSKADRLIFTFGPKVSAFSNSYLLFNNSFGLKLTVPHVNCSHGILRHGKSSHELRTQTMSDKNSTDV